MHRSDMGLPLSQHLNGDVNLAYHSQMDDGASIKSDISMLSLLRMLYKRGSISRSLARSGILLVMGGLLH